MCILATGDFHGEPFRLCMSGSHAPRRANLIHSNSVQLKSRDWVLGELLLSNLLVGRIAALVVANSAILAQGGRHVILSI